MNSAEQKAQADSARIFRVTNPFDFEYTHAWGGVPYTLPVGKPLLFPFPLADHLATHLARQAIIRKAPMRDATETDGKGTDRPLWTDEKIAEMKKSIMVEEYREEAAPVLTENEILAKKIDELNKRFDDMGGNKSVEDDEETTTTAGDPVIADASTYKDKAEVITELEKRGITFDARASKAKLEELLK